MMSELASAVILSVLLSVTAAPGSQGSWCVFRHHFCVQGWKKTHKAGAVPVCPSFIRKASACSGVSGWNLVTLLSHLQEFWESGGGGMACPIWIRPVTIHSLDSNTLPSQTRGSDGRGEMRMGRTTNCVWWACEWCWAGYKVNSGSLCRIFEECTDLVLRVLEHCYKIIVVPLFYTFQLSN